MPYISLSETKAHLRLTGTTWDEFITQLLPMVSEMCDDLTGRTLGVLGSGFETHSLTVRYQMTNPKRGIMLPEWPVQSIGSITINDTAVPAAEYRLQGRIGFIQFTDTVGNPVDKSGRINITFVAGFPTVPAAVGLACLRALSYVKQRADEEGLGAELLGPMQTTWRALFNHGRMEIEDIVNTHVGRYEIDVLTSLDEGELA